MFISGGGEFAIEGLRESLLGGAWVFLFGGSKLMDALSRVLKREAGGRVEAFCISLAVGSVCSSVARGGETLFT